MKKKWVICKYCLRSTLKERQTKKGCWWCDEDYHAKKRRDKK